MEKLKIESSLKEVPKVEVITIDSHEESSTSETVWLRKIKPRALILKADEKVFRKLKDAIKTQFPEVEIIYVTTGPAASILRVTKSIPFELQNSSAQPYYTVE
jgi:excinuclease UvrABC nuclease subunit